MNSLVVNSMGALVFHGCATAYVTHKAAVAVSFQRRERAILYVVMAIWWFSAFGVSHALTIGLGEAL